MSILSRLIAASLGVWLISALPALPDGIVNTGGVSTAIIPGTTVVAGGAANCVLFNGASSKLGCLSSFIYDGVNLGLGAANYGSCAQLTTNPSGTLLCGSVIYGPLNGTNAWMGINTFSSATPSTTPLTGAVVISAGGLGVNGALNVASGITAPALTGGTIATGALLLVSTSNGAPSGDLIAIKATTTFFQSAGGVTYGSLTSAGMNLASGEAFSVGAAVGVTKGVGCVIQQITGGLITATTGC